MALVLGCVSGRAQPDAPSPSSMTSTASLDVAPLTPDISPPAQLPPTSQVAPTPHEHSRSGDVTALLSEVRQSCGQSAKVEQFSSALGVELEASPFARPEPAATRLVRCDIEAATLTLLVKGREVTIDVSDVPIAARARTLAVALAETLRLPPEEVPLIEPSDASATATRDVTMPTDVSPRPSSEGELFPTPNVVTGRPDTPWQAAVTLSAMVQGPKATIAPGFNLALSRVLFDGLQLSGQVGYLTAADTSTLGRARLHAASLEASLDYRVLKPSSSSSLDVGAGVALHRAFVTIDSAWGVDEPDVHAWFALVHARATFASTVSDRVRWLTQLRVVKDAVGLRLTAGGQEAMSFHGWGAELRLGAAYVW